MTWPRSAYDDNLRISTLAITCNGGSTAVVTIRTAPASAHIVPLESLHNTQAWPAMYMKTIDIAIIQWLRNPDEECSHALLEHAASPRGLPGEETYVASWWHRWLSAFQPLDSYWIGHLRCIRLLAAIILLTGDLALSRDPWVMQTCLSRLCAFSSKT